MKEYRAIQQVPDVRRLVALDQKLSSLVENIQEGDKEGTSGRLWKPEYEAMGLYVGHYSEQIGYSGKLLLQAHQLNPHSPQRNRTLFAGILGEGSPDGLGEMPNIKQAYQYLREFPNGPYAGKTHAILGTFYSDLYKVLRALQKDPKNSRDYKYKCFAPYIQRGALEAQAREARGRATTDLGRAVAALPKDPRTSYLREELAAMRRGEESMGWSWCSD